MTLETVILIAVIFISALNLAVAVYLMKDGKAKAKKNDGQEIAAYIDEAVRRLAEQQLQIKSETTQEHIRVKDETNKAVLESMGTMGNLIIENSKFSSDAQARHIGENLENFRQSLNNNMAQTENRFQTFSSENNQKLDNMRETMEKQLTAIQESNVQKLDEMRMIVDEKLQKTINQRINESFRLVNERLEQVYKGLGEMRSLANGVGDLKKVLSNVKTRGILGEVQLASILKEIMSPEQYETNVATKPGSRAVVEFAVKIPVDDGFIYMPIDSKFPGDTYSTLRDAYEKGDTEEISAASKILTNTLRAEAKDIHDKYLAPPATTDFAVMFLPFEGLYAEAINSGMVEILQREYNVNIAGPSTMAALLNSLQMGFRSFAIQQRSGEVWNVLSAVKTEFSKFEESLKMTQQRLIQANDELDKLVGVRTRQIQRKLRDVTEIDDFDSRTILGLSEEKEEEV